MTNSNFLQNAHMTLPRNFHFALHAEKNKHLYFYPHVDIVAILDTLSLKLYSEISRIFFQTLTQLET